MNDKHDHETKKPVLNNAEAGFTITHVDVRDMVATSPSDFWLRGNVYAEAGEFELALADFNRAVALEPDASEFYRDRAAVYNQLGNYDLALTDLARSLALDPNDAGAYVQQGAAYLALDQPEQAVAAFGQAVALEPEVASHYYNRALAHFNCEAYSDAAADFEQAIALEPPYESARQKLAVTRMMLGEASGEEDHAASIEAYSELISREPGNAAAYINRAVGHFHLGDFEQVIADASRAIELDPGNDLAYQNRAAAYGKLGRRDLELADATRAIELNPTEPDHYLNRAIAYANYEGSRYEEALTDYHKTLELAPDHPDAIYGMACVYALMHEPATSLRHLEQAIRLNPDYGSYAQDDGDFGWLRENDPAFAVAFDQLTTTLT